jgi:phosphatidylglycerol:prolipoprotein diacylglycerol transferase
MLYCKIKKVKFIDYLELCMPSVALAQAFGRVGCFFAGCCYGRETDCAIGVTFHNSLYAPNGVKLIPTQLISAGGDLLNMALLLFIAKHTKKKGTVTACYIMFYSVGRYLVEMLRADERGSVGALSTSQFYGIFSLVIGVAIFIFAQTRKSAVAEAPVEESAEAAVEEVKENETV